MKKSLFFVVFFILFIVSLFSEWRLPSEPLLPQTSNLDILIFVLAALAALAAIIVLLIKHFKNKLMVIFGIVLVFSGTGLILYGSFNYYSIGRSGGGSFFSRGLVATGQYFIIPGVFMAIIGIMLCIAWIIRRKKINESTFYSINQSKNVIHTKNCPYCANDIKNEAIICQYCSKDVSHIKYEK